MGAFTVIINWSAYICRFLLLFVLFIIICFCCCFIFFVCLFVCFSQPANILSTAFVDVGKVSLKTISTDLNSLKLTPRCSLFTRNRIYVFIFSRQKISPKSTSKSTRNTTLLSSPYIYAANMANLTSECYFRGSPKILFFFFFFFNFSTWVQIPLRANKVFISF